MIENDLKIIHDELFELLIAFDNLCKICQINYSLHGGTLIGAMRYGDFIPWDDDADVTLMSWDYIKLKDYIDAHPELDFRLVDTDGISCRFQRTKLDGHPMCWLDIIEYNYITGNKIGQKIKIFTLITLYAMGQSKEHVKTATRKKHSSISLFIYKILYYLGFLFGKQRILLIHKKVRRKWFNGEKKFIHRSNDQAGSLSYILPVEWYSNYKRVSLHEYMFLITTCYDEMLTQCYGKDWLIPPDKADRIPHENTVRSVYKDLQTKYERSGK